MSTILTNTHIVEYWNRGWATIVWRLFAEREQNCEGNKIPYLSEITGILIRNFIVEILNWQTGVVFSMLKQWTNDILKSIIDYNLLIKRIRARINSSPWVTNEYLSMSVEYRSKQYTKCPCQFHLDQTKESQRAVHRLKNQLKRDFIRKTIHQNKRNPKKLSKNIRLFWPKENSKNTNIVTTDGKSIDADKANELNTFLLM